MNIRIREAVRQFANRDVGVFKYFCTVIVIFFVIKKSCSLVVLSYSYFLQKAIVFSEKFFRMNLLSVQLGGLQLLTPSYALVSLR